MKREIMILGGKHTASLKNNMFTHAPFVVTSIHSRSDLGRCIISTDAPHYIAKINTFRTCARDERIAARNDEIRKKWLENVCRTHSNAQSAERQHIPMREYVAHFLGLTYDEELDEARVIAKVPGLNIYIEMFGVGDAAENAEERIPDVIRSMATWYRTFLTHRDRRECATKSTDWQPLAEWMEEYDENEYFRLQEKKGIGFDFIDPSRREPVYTKHSFSPEEKEELARLKAEAAAQGIPVSPALLQHKAAANVRAARLIRK